MLNTQNYLGKIKHINCPPPPQQRAFVQVYVAVDNLPLPEQRSTHVNNNTTVACLSINYKEAFGRAKLC